MVLEDYLDMTLREILDTYCVVYNLECDYCYGVSKFDTVDELYNNYNIDEEYPEAFYPEYLINNEILDYLEEDLLDYQKLTRIMDNLGITQK